MNEAEKLASTASRCIWTTHAPGSFYTNAVTTVSRVLDGSGGATPRSSSGGTHGPSESLQSPRRGNAAMVAWASASLLTGALTCVSLLLRAFSLPRGPLALPAGGEPCSRFLRSGLQMCRLLEQLGLLYPG